MKLTRRHFLLGSSALALSTSLPRLAQAQTSTLSWSAVRGDDKDFFRAPVLLSGEKEAILIDGSFNLPAGEQMAALIKDSGKQLTTIYISCPDPDYYFSLKPIKAAFPEARVIAASETIAAIDASVQGKLDTWGPQLGEFGPQTQEDIVFAEPFDEKRLMLEDQPIDIVTSERMHNRRYLWVPSLNAVVGGVYAFDGLHVWTADSPTKQDRQHWIAELDELIARDPAVVVAGHAASGTNNGVASLQFTREYLLAFEQAFDRTGNSEELIAAMQARYPDLGLMPALEIGAKVSKGEMDW